MEIGNSNLVLDPKLDKSTDTNAVLGPVIKAFNTMLTQCRLLDLWHTLAQDYTHAMIIVVPWSDHHKFWVLG